MKWWSRVGCALGLLFAGLLFLGVEIIYRCGGLASVLPTSENPCSFGNGGLVICILLVLGFVLLLYCLITSSETMLAALFWTIGWVGFWMLAIADTAHFCQICPVQLQHWLIYPLTVIGTWLLWPVFLVWMIFG
jgi:hypothetical protein